MRRMAVIGGAGVREMEMVRDGDGNSRAGMGTREGRRGGADDTGEGSSGRVIEGAGLGCGIDLDSDLENNEHRCQLEKQQGTDNIEEVFLAECMDCDSARSRERKDLYSGW